MAFIIDCHVNNLARHFHVTLKYNLKLGIAFLQDVAGYVP